MTEQPGKPGRIDRLLTGPQITVGGRTVQPVARAGGQYISSQAANGGGAAAWVQVTPVEVIVRETDGAESHVPIVDATRQAIRGMVAAGLTLAGVCLAIMLIVNLARLVRKLQ